MMVTHLPRHQRLAMRRLTRQQEHPQSPVVHDHATIALFAEGEVEFWLHGVYRLTAGSILLVPAGVPHYLISASRVRSVGVSICLSCGHSGADAVKNVLML